MMRASLLLPSFQEEQKPDIDDMTLMPNRWKTRRAGAGGGIEQRNALSCHTAS
jgi:hypothetical protein